RGVQQQLSAARWKAAAIDSDSVASCHCLFPEGFKFPFYGWCEWPPPALPGMLNVLCCRPSPSDLLQNVDAHRLSTHHGQTMTVSWLRVSSSAPSPSRELGQHRPIPALLHHGPRRATPPPHSSHALLRTLPTNISTRT